MRIENPYTRMLTYPDSKRYYGSETVLFRIIEGVSTPDTPKSFELVGLPGTGKTSLLRYIVDRQGALEEHSIHFAQRSSFQYLPVHVEFRLMASDVHPFLFIYDRMLDAWDTWSESELEGSSALESVMASPVDVASADEAAWELERACRALDRNQIRPLLVLDDFDIPFKTMSASEATRLRPLRDSTAFLIAVEKPLHRVNPEAVGSPFFYNIGTIRFTGMTAVEAAHLVQGPALEAGNPLPDDDIHFLIQQVGRFPSLLVHGAEVLWELRMKYELEPDAVLSKEQTGLILGQLRRVLEPIFHIYWNRLNEREKDALLSLARQSRSVSQIEYEVLSGLEIDTGFVEADNSFHFHFFSPLFEEYINGQRTLPEKDDSQPSSSLTGLDRKLYQYLSDHEDQICTFEDILEAIWDEPLGDGENQVLGKRRVQVSISRLRSKIGDDEIVSVRDQGYRLVRRSSN